MAGLAQRVLALAIHFWDALERKREKPVVPATPDVFSLDGEGHVWDLSTQLPACFDHTAYEWDTRPAICGLWPVARLVCERGRLIVLLPEGQRRPSEWEDPSELSDKLIVHSPQP